jgi:hypothetical protein
MYITTLSLRTKRESSNQQVVNRTTLIAHLQLYAFGRTHPIPGLPTIGPCINRVPVRIDLRRDVEQTQRLETIQRQYAESIAHEIVGLPDIVRNCTDWPENTRYTAFVQYQNVSEYLQLDIPGVIEGLRSRDVFDTPVAADYLEFFAVPSEDGTKLRVHVIAGWGFDGALQEDFCEGSDVLCVIGRVKCCLCMRLISVKMAVVRILVSPSR